MSKFPLIHSFSTVGVVKHYNQDYLIHQKRTDFTGPNGIGKSLLADLLQILLIADNKKITFGTDSFKKEDRQVHTIPYKTDDAYFFINIEIESKKYITLGVNIPNTRSRPIRMFRILNNYFDPEKEARKNLSERKKLTGLLIPEEKLPYNADFLDGKTIPKIEKLVKNLRDNKSLYLNIYTTKAEKKELYQFLFDKEVLPLNLSVDAHLIAFAKVLQAFSKANTLNTDKDSSLKSFLFEDKKAEIESEYKKNKEKLDSLIDRYKELKELTDLLENKQEYLEDLKEKRETFIYSERLYLKTKYTSELKEYNKQIGIWKKDEETFNHVTKEIKALEKSLPELKIAEQTSSSKYLAYTDTMSNLTTYKTHYDEYQKKLKDYNELVDCVLPDVSKEVVENFSFEGMMVKDILPKIKELASILTKYSSLEKIEEQYKNQINELGRLKQTLLLKKERLDKIKKIVDFKDNKTLAAQIITTNKQLNKAQEVVLLNLLLDVNWSKPTTLNNGICYTDNLSILDASNIVEDVETGGYWFNQGKLNHFVKYSSKKQIFDSKKNFKEAFIKKAKEIDRSILNLDNQISDIDSHKIESLITKIPDLDLKWDKSIPDIRKVGEYATNISMVKNIDMFKQILRENLEKDKKALDVLKEKIPFKFSDQKIVETIRKNSNQEKELNDKQIKASNEKARAETKLQLKLERLTELNYNPDEIEKRKSTLESELDASKIEIESKYSNIIEKIDIEEFDGMMIEEVNTQYFNNKSDYETKYKDVTKLYPSLRDDIEVREQVSNKNFSFSLLERKLLGNTIFETKNIAQALKSANEEKRNMSATLKETMLKIFQKTHNEYEVYRGVIASLNIFFKNKLISEKYYFEVRFDPNKNFSIQWINDLQSKTQNVGNTGELFESDSVEKFVEDFFKDASGYRKEIAFSDLLDPKTYFTLKTEFKDEEGNEYPGSTGESYTARVLLGIGRLSITSKEKRKGLRFLILEEVASLDPSNFNTFPELAEEFGYQIITMTPEPFGSNSEDGWYLHQLIKGKNNDNINYHIPNSCFKTNYSNEQLMAYLNRNKS